MGPAPLARATMAAMRPMGPAPVMRTLFPETPLPA